jgi:hypothetical protein
MEKVYCLLILTSYLFLSCGTSTPSDGDERRSGAKETLLGITVDDKISAGSGDKTDWKRFALEDSADITINFYWDNPKVSVKVLLRDQFGGELKILNHQEGIDKESIEAKLTEGQYFLQIESLKGESVYTLEILTPDLAGGSGIPRPE